MSDEHKYELVIEDGWVRLFVECSYDAADESRPCWPYDEAGKREPAPQAACVIAEWVDNCAPEDVLHGEVRVPVECEAEWSDYSLALHVRDESKASA